MINYKPTPRDLFNPPPQAEEPGSFSARMIELNYKTEELNPHGQYTNEQNLFYGILGMLEYLKERIR